MQFNDLVRINLYIYISDELQVQTTGLLRTSIEKDQNSTPLLAATKLHLGLAELALQADKPHELRLYSCASLPAVYLRARFAI